MSIVNMRDYQNKTGDNHISGAELKNCIAHLQRQAQQAGFDEVTNLLALAHLAAHDLETR